MNLTNLQQMIEGKYISLQKHPDRELYIYNYTQKAQFDRVWNEETLSCRGLIMDENKNIVARPFKKFFNLQEILNQGGQIPAEDFIVTEKMDGSLGILYWDGDTPCLATRGSFVSDQAIHGTKILHERYSHVPFNKDATYLFEIIYPSNRIVVDYGELDDLVLLTAIATRDNIEMPYDALQSFGDHWKLPYVKKYDGVRDFSKIEAEDNKEGYVITFPSTAQRFKIKFDEYVRLHRLVTGVNARSIWDLLRNKQPFDELLERVPDEFYAWVKKTKVDLEGQYTEIADLAKKEHIKASLLPTRKEQALAIKDFQYKSLVFNMLDEKDYSETLWKLLKPKAERPFKEEI